MIYFELIPQAGFISEDSTTLKLPLTEPRVRSKEWSIIIGEAEIELNMIWLHRVLIWAIVLLGVAVSSSSTEVVRRRDTISYNEVTRGAAFDGSSKASMYINNGADKQEQQHIYANKMISEEDTTGANLPPTTKRSHAKYGTIRGGGSSSTLQQNHQTQRRTEDLEDILMKMASKDPSEWSIGEWFLMILFLSFISWLGCCLLSLCCCGRQSSNICAWLCLWEICCNDGRHIDQCCDYALN